MSSILFLNLDWDVCCYAKHANRDTTRAISRRFARAKGKKSADTAYERKPRKNTKLLLVFLIRLC